MLRTPRFHAELSPGRAPWHSRPVQRCGVLGVVAPALVLAVALALAPAAARADGEVVCGVVPPLYGNPPLQAATRALPQLEDLGVNVVWLAPVFEAEPRDYGYAVTDYGRVRESWARRRTCARSSTRRTGAACGAARLRAQPHLRPPPVVRRRAGARARFALLPFYTRDPAGRPTHYFDWLNLPNLDYTRGEVRRAMSDATTA